MLVRPFSLDMVPGGVPLLIHVSQYDSDQQLALSLFSSQGTLVVPPTGVTAAIRGTKLDGNGISNACTVSKTNRIFVPKMRACLKAETWKRVETNPFDKPIKINKV